MRIVIALMVACSLRAATVSDSFNYNASDTGLLSNSSMWSGESVGGGQTMRITTGYGVAGGNSSQYGAAYSSSTFGSAQFAQALFIGSGSNRPGIAVRIDTATSSWYGCVHDGSSVILYSSVGGSRTNLGSSANTWTAGDIIRLTVTDAHLLSCVVIDRATGSNRFSPITNTPGSPITGNRVGPFGQQVMASGRAIDDFIGGDLADMLDYQPLTSDTNKYVSTTGTLHGNGTKDYPWPIQKVSHDAEAGWQVWLRAGNYNYTAWKALVAAGTATAPIIYRPYPGEAVLIDGNGAADGFKLQGNYNELRGVEVTNTSTVGSEVPVNTASNVDLRPGPISSTDGTVGHKIINSLIHDVQQGFAGDGTNEIYGNVTWNLSVDSEDDAHGHSAYIRHGSPVDSGTKLVAENLFMSGGSGYGVHAYGEISQRFTWRGNVNNYGNAIWWDSVGPDPANLTIEENFHSPISTSQLGYRYYTNPNAATVTGNVFGPISMRGRSLTMTGNRIIGAVTQNPSSADCDWSESTINDNDYYNETAFNSEPNGGCAGDSLSWAEWQAFGHDATGSISASDPTGTWTYVRPNAYEAGRGHVIIYNWDEAATVNVDISSILSVGDRYQIFNAMRPLTVIATGTYAGGNVSFDMSPVSNPAYTATDLNTRAWNSCTPSGSVCPGSVATAEGWQSGSGAPAGACSPEMAWYMNTDNGRMYYCSSGSWVSEANNTTCECHAFPVVQTSEVRFGVFIIRRVQSFADVSIGAACESGETATLYRGDGPTTLGAYPSVSLTCSGGKFSGAGPAIHGRFYQRLCRGSVCGVVEESRQ